MTKLIVSFFTLLSLMLNLIGIEHYAEASVSGNCKIDYVRVFDGQLVVHYTFTNTGDEWCWADADINNIKVYSTANGYDELIYEGSLSNGIGSTYPGGSIEGSASVNDSKYRRISNDCIWWSVDSVTPVLRAISAPKGVASPVNRQATPLTTNQSGKGYQRVFRIASHFYMDKDKGDIYIDFDNIKDITCIREDNNVKVIRYLVPVMTHNLTTGTKQYYEYLFQNVPSQTPDIWDSKAITNNSRWYGLSVEEWSRISPDDWYRIANDPNDLEIIWCQSLGVHGYTEDYFRGIDWSAINYALHDDYGVLLKSIMYLKGYHVPLDTYIP